MLLLAGRRKRYAMEGHAQVQRIGAGVVVGLLPMNFNHAIHFEHTVIIAGTFI